MCEEAKDPKEGRGGRREAKKRLAGCQNRPDTFKKFSLHVVYVYVEEEKETLSLFSFLYHFPMLSFTPNFLD